MSDATDTDAMTQTTHISRLQESRNRRRNRLLAFIGVISILGSAMLFVPF